MLKAHNFMIPRDWVFIYPSTSEEIEIGFRKNMYEEIL